jgi:hypothetical protein
MYEQARGWYHVATLDLAQTGRTVTGTWSDGTRIRGSGGSLKGELVGGVVYVHLCGADPHSGYPICPEFAGEVTDRLARRERALVWCQGSGKQFDEYLVLHPVADGTSPISDGDCSQDAP